jgi:hypothetical protein
MSVRRRQPGGQEEIQRRLDGRIAHVFVLSATQGVDGALHDGPIGVRRGRDDGVQRQLNACDAGFKNLHFSLSVVASTPTVGRPVGLGDLCASIAGGAAAEDLVNDEDRGLLADFRTSCAQPEGAAA